MQFRRLVGYKKLNWQSKGLATTPLDVALIERFPHTLIDVHFDIAVFDHRKLGVSD